MTGDKTDTPILLWVRRDLRLGDNPMLASAVATGRPLIPVFICDGSVTSLGAAAKWRLGQGLEAFGAVLDGVGSRLILRRGEALPILRDLVAETGAGAVWWARLYDRDARARDTGIKESLREDGLEARSFAGHLLFEPWEVETGAGGPYKVFSPFWRAVRDRSIPAPQAAPTQLHPPATWPASEDLDDWGLGRGVRRGAPVLAGHARVGEALAQARLADFMADEVEDYPTIRNRVAQDGCSDLSEPLTYGEIGPRQIWHAGWLALHQGAGGAEAFLRQLVWREFAWHLMYHAPEMDRENWRGDWDSFAWRGDNADAERWRRGMTGEPFVDAAMRQMYVTGRMHNRARMIAASYLTKHLLTDWRVGLRWFADCLTDWDPAANALGWQWVAGSGPDAAPYFRVFNPATQAEKFDPAGAYRHRFIAEGQDAPPREAAEFFAACPVRWGLSADQPYPDPVISLAEGRNRALAAYSAR